MTFFKAATKEQIPGKGGHDGQEMFDTKSKQRFDEIYELANVTIRYNLYVAQQVVAPPHTERKHKTAVNMPEFVGGIAEEIENNRRILHIT